MLKGQSLALVEVSPATFGYLPYPGLKNYNALIWKALVITLVVLFSLVALPWQQTMESTLTRGEMVTTINQNRVRIGLSPLKTDPRLEAAARAKALDILQKGYFAHTSPQGVKPWDFISTAGLPYAFAGENLALNYTDTSELVNDLLQSPSHRENLLSPLFSEIGVAVVEGSYHGQPAIVTVQMFATPLP